MSDGPRCGPYAIAKDLALAAKNAAAELRLGAATLVVVRTTHTSGRLPFAPSTAIRRSPSPRSSASGGGE
jgi:hypothetical protein